jgi:RNA polymerase sigma-70 factor (TIGR02960 family)
MNSWTPGRTETDRWHHDRVTSTELERARAGDAGAFAELVAPHRQALHLHCYRMLGSLTEADDALQETLVAAWQGLAGFRADASVRTWLYRIATNRCLNAMRDARRRRPAEPQPPFTPPPPTRLGEVTWLQPYPDASVPALERESIELAFVTALQRIPPRQTAVLLLRDVLAFSTTEAAGILGMTPVAVKAALQRARSQVRRPAAGNRASHRALAERFARALTDGDIAGVLELLSDDAWLAMPPAPHEYHGRAAVGAFLTASARWRGPGGLSLMPTSANGQPAFCEYQTEPVGVLVLTVLDDRIVGITRFLDGRLPGRFALG